MDTIVLVGVAVNIGDIVVFVDGVVSNISDVFGVIRVVGKIGDEKNMNKKMDETDHRYKML